MLLASKRYTRSRPTQPQSGSQSSCCAQELRGHYGTASAQCNDGIYSMRLSRGIALPLAAGKLPFQESVRQRTNLGHLMCVLLKLRSILKGFLAFGILNLSLVLLVTLDFGLAGVSHQFRLRLAARQTCCTSLGFARSVTSQPTSGADASGCLHGPWHRSFRWFWVRAVRGSCEALHFGAQQWLVNIGNLSAERGAPP